MSDQDLRDLERLASSGEAEAVLAYARALDRVGRGDDAYLALWAHVGVERIRRELARRPASLQAAHLTRQAVDVAPVLRSPRLRWKTALEFSHHTRALRASPLGLVVSHFHLRLHNWVIDAHSGETRFEVAHVSPMVIREDVLLCSDWGRRHVGYDLYAGATLFEWLTPDGHGSASQLGEAQLTTSASQQGRVTEVAIHDWPDPRLAPSQEPLWRGPALDESLRPAETAVESNELPRAHPSDALFMARDTRYVGDGDFLVACDERGSALWSFDLARGEECDTRRKATEPSCTTRSITALPRRVYVVTHSRSGPFVCLTCIEGD